MQYQTLFHSNSEPIRYCRLVVDQMQYHYAVSFDGGRLQAVTMPDNEDENDDRRHE